MSRCATAMVYVFSPRQIPSSCHHSPEMEQSPNAHRSSPQTRLVLSATTYAVYRLHRPSPSLHRRKCLHPLPPRIRVHPHHHTVPQSLLTLHNPSFMVYRNYLPHNPTKVVCRWSLRGRSRLDATQRSTTPSQTVPIRAGQIWECMIRLQQPTRKAMQRRTAVVCEEVKMWKVYRRRHNPRLHRL